MALLRLSFDFLLLGRRWRGGGSGHLAIRTRLRLLLLSAVALLDSPD
jgi:hypothetical protein